MRTYYIFILTVEIQFPTRPMDAMSQLTYVLDDMS